MDNTVLKLTNDGSHTLLVPGLDETYHSTHGAIQEALHVYIAAGFGFFKNRRPLDILEVGFGTGLNAFLTYREAVANKINVNYSCIEAFPLDISIVKKLNYLTHLQAQELETHSFIKMHELEWGEKTGISPFFSFTKLLLTVQDYHSNHRFDVIYFDAFGPRVQEEMWVESILEKMYVLLSDGGILVTYCAKGDVKRRLKSVGFRVESLPGPPGKREMVRAIKDKDE